MNALEMLELTKTLSTLRNDCLSLLENLQNADGGWGFHAGVQSRVEPTSWSARALSHSAKSGDTKNFRSATAFLRSRQLPDGSWPACAEMSAGSWITSLACSVLAADPESAKNVAAGLKWLCDDFPRDSSPWRRFVRRIRNESHLAKQDDSYRGWGWTPKTSSWVEPTAFALMALREAPAAQLPENAGQRRELAVALLYDRMCPGGGWNCGNPSVYGVDGEALVLPTCWALLALREAQEKPGRALSLAWLQKEFAKIESAASLAVARMTLENYGIERQTSPDIVTPPAKRDLQDWSAQELAEQGTHVLAWTCMALNPDRPWPVVAAKNMTGNVMGGAQ
jgi:squalene cyclase